PRGPAAMNSFLHLANVLYLVSYSVRDILWLRILTVIAIVSMMPYYYCQQVPLLAPICWQSLFLAVNLVQIGILILERRPVFLGDEELAIYRSVFRSLRPREFMKLLSVAEWKKAKQGEILLEQGKP